MMWLIRLGQGLIGDTWPARLLVRSGVVRWMRSGHDRRLLQAGRYDAVVAGRRLCFAVETREQVEHIDAVWREQAMLERMLEALKPTDTVFDIGAHIGTLAMRLAGGLDPTDPKAVVHAFEPEPGNAASLERNIELNDGLNVRVHQFALGASPGRFPLAVSGQAGSGNNTLRPADSGRACIEVEVQTADRVDEELNAKPALVKIDVEGAEVDVLMGMCRLLEQQVVRDLFIEVHPRLIAQQDHSPSSIEQMLAGHGYELCWSSQRGEEVHQHYRRIARSNG